MKRMTANPLANLAGLASVVFVGMLSGCMPAGPVTYDEAGELREEIARLEEQLETAERELEAVRGDQLPADSNQVIRQASENVTAVLVGLAEVRGALRAPDIQPQTPPTAPAGAGGSSM
jgi:HAMP domain-containing protein